MCVAFCHLLEIPAKQLARIKKKEAQGRTDMITNCKMNQTLQDSNAQKTNAMVLLS